MKRLLTYALIYSLFLSPVPLAARLAVETVVKGAEGVEFASVNDTKTLTPWRK